eukprot:TRINITY_DN7523_c0_g1_i1.p2 TRINITY_DN7523_c0_g1~~TRINITY_DN7523_c0_g1_i1.p2  ORF type:complete len:338 (-),score=36.46 TRINITY_DN7523_c0_g1_i1:1655-2668(-)
MSDRDSESGSSSSRSSRSSSRSSQSSSQSSSRSSRSGSNSQLSNASATSDKAKKADLSGSFGTPARGENVSDSGRDADLGESSNSAPGGRSALMNPDLAASYINPIPEEDGDVDDLTAAFTAAARGKLNPLRRLVRRNGTSPRRPEFLRATQQLAPGVPGLDGLVGNLLECAILWQHDQLIAWLCEGSDCGVLPTGREVFFALRVGRDATALRLLADHPEVFHPDARDAHGNRILHILCARTPPPVGAILQFVATPGVDADAVNAAGVTPLLVISRTLADTAAGRVVARAFRKAGADLDFRGPDGRNAAAATWNYGLREGLRLDVPTRLRAMPDVDP